MVVEVAPDCGPSLIMVPGSTAGLRTESAPHKLMRFCWTNLIWSESPHQPSQTHLHLLHPPHHLHQPLLQEASHLPRLPPPGSSLQNLQQHHSERISPADQNQIPIKTQDVEPDKTGSRTLQWTHLSFPLLPDFLYFLIQSSCSSLQTQNTVKNTAGECYRTKTLLGHSVVIFFKPCPHAIWDQKTSSLKYVEAAIVIFH